MIVPYGWTVPRLAREAGLRWSTVIAYLEGRWVTDFAARRIQQALGKARR